MEEGILYLACTDCEAHPDPRIREASSIAIFRGFDRLDGKVVIERMDLEGWLKRHIEGECSGAQRDSGGLLHVVNAARIAVEYEPAEEVETLIEVVP